MYVDPLSDLNLHVVITQIKMPQCFMPKTPKLQNLALIF